MTEMTRVHTALLELGLEDLIPLPEALSEAGVYSEDTGDQLVTVVGHALVDLLRNDLIQVFSGHWSVEPVLVSREAAEAMLLDQRRYSYDAEVDGTERVYYVNVDNYRE